MLSNVFTENVNLKNGKKLEQNNCWCPNLFVGNTRLNNRDPSTQT
jgi:hypothetical protein